MTDQRLRRIAGALSIVGIGVAGYLTYVHYAGLRPVCGISHGCETVQTSRYAYLAGLPVALLGLFTYIAVLVSACSTGERARLSAFGLSLVGFLFSAYLTFRELFTIHAICSWCVSSAVVFTILAVVGSIRLLVAVPDPLPGGARALGLSQVGGTSRARPR